MRAGLSTIQQTLTPEAASVLNRSMGEAARRSHGQTTPLHVAATLLAAPSGLLRQACIRSHPTSSHPLQCRALELCFSVALDRLPTTTTTSSSSGNNNPSAAVSEPPISNALMAALKRAQAHQRRGCPEQQQQPLLAVKVELEQLVISILDDPSVSRVMREASFSSPDVKATIEQSLSASPSPSPAANPTPAAAAAAVVGLGLGLAHRAPTARNLYMNPRLNQHQGTGGAGDPTGKDELKRVVDIMMRPEKRNPVLVADADPVAVMREVLRRIETGDAPPPLRSAHVIPLEKEWNSHRAELPAKIKELGGSIEARIGACSGVILDLGDLKWLVDSPGGVSVSSTSGQIQQQIVSETARAAVAEMGKLLGKFGSRVWLFGAATCATYLRCQVYHPTMEKDWDLQAVPIAPRSPLPNFFPRHGGNGILSSSVESLAPIKGFPSPGATTAPLRCPSEGTDSSRKATMCPACMDNYERELAKLVAKEPEKPPPSSDSKPDTRQALPHWLQLAKPGSTESRADQLQSKEQEFRRKHKADELLKRWRDTCSRLHPTPRPVLIGPERPPAMAFSLSNGYNPPAFPPRKPFEPKAPLPRSINQLSNQSLRSSETRCATPPRSLVKTDLVLGHLKASDATLEKAHSERVKDVTGCAKDGFSDKTAGISDYDSFKRLFKGLAEKVGWQPEAASAVATVVMQCKSGNGKTRGVGASKGDTWLLFAGPDKVGKRKMASALSELVFGAGPITIHLGGGSPRTQCESGQSGMNFRGRTSIDMVADAVRRNPFSVVVLEGIDRADALAKGSIKRAIERGRLLDSQGREVGLGSVIFVLTTDWLPDELKSSHDSGLQFEDRITELVNCGWQLELSVGDKPGKRDAEREGADGRSRPAKLRKESLGGGALSLDLNLAVGVEDDAGEGSWNSSDLTVEHEQESLRLTINCTAPSSACELMGSVDEAIVFKPVDFGPLRRKILESISTKFDAMVGGAQLIRVDEDVLDRLVGGVWLAGAVATGGFEEWAERVLVPSLQKLKRSMKAGDVVLVLRLSAAKGGQRQWTGGDWLPETVAIAGNQTGWAAEA